MRGSHVTCPFHVDHTPSLWVDEDSHCYCFSCSWHGSIVDLMVVMGYSGRDLLLKQDEFLRGLGWAAYESGEQVRPKTGWEQASVGLDLTLPKVYNRWRFLLDRGYTMATLAAFDTHSYQGVVFGWPVGGVGGGEKWVTRWVAGEWKRKYLYDPGLSRATLYARAEGDFDYLQAIIVEGVLDVMKVWQAVELSPLSVGIFATLGSPTASQMRQIGGFPCVYEMFDNDSGGDAHRRALARYNVKARRIQYNGGDPGDCSDSALIEAVIKGIEQP